jgi:hypothetical protein
VLIASAFPCLPCCSSHRRGSPWRWRRRPGRGGSPAGPHGSSGGPDFRYSAVRCGGGAAFGACVWLGDSSSSQAGTSTSGCSQPQQKQSPPRPTLPCPSPAHAALDSRARLAYRSRAQAALHQLNNLAHVLHAVEASRELKAVGEGWAAQHKVGGRVGVREGEGLWLVRGFGR